MEEKEQGKAEAVEEEADFDPGFLKRIFEEHAPKFSQGRPTKPLPRLKVEFVVDHEACAPGVFPEDFRLALLGATSYSEQLAAKDAKGDPAVMAIALAKSSMHAVNGTPVVGVQREWLWEALGAGGRNLVMERLVDVQAPSEDAQKKATESLVVSG